MLTPHEHKITLSLSIVNKFVGINLLKIYKKTVGKTYDLSGEKPLQMIEVFNMISYKLDKKTIFISIPLRLGVFLARVAKILSLRKIDYVEKVQRMAEDRSYAHEEAKKDFNYKPMSFNKGIEIEIEQYLSK